MLVVDKTIVISLKEQELRRQQTKIQLAKLGIKPNFLIVDRDVGHEERGCFNSHLLACKQVFTENLNHILICEDDVLIRAFQPEQLEKINLFIDKKRHQFDVLYLGLIISKMWFTLYPSIVGTKGAGLHAYILSRRGAEKLANYQYEGTPIDKVIKHDFKCYSIYPIIAEQYAETFMPSAITPTRCHAPIKSEAFWQQNYAKQKWLPWKNLHKSFMEIFTAATPLRGKIPL